MVACLAYGTAAVQFLIVDDHPVVREGVAAVLRQSAPGNAVLHATDGPSALATVAQHPGLDVVFLDLMLPPPGGLALLESLGARHPGLPVVMLSSSEDPDDVRRALARGALGYVPKSASSATLLAALRLVLEGEIYVPPFVVQDADRQTGFGADGLTERQIEVLRLLAAETSNKEIAYRLGVSEKTVKAVKAAREKGLI